MEPTTPKTTVNAPLPGELPTAPSDPEKSGEVERLIHQLEAAAENLSIEFAALVSRLKNVLPELPPQLDNQLAKERKPMRSQAGMRLDDLLNKIDLTASAIRTTRTNLEN